MAMSRFSAASATMSSNRASRIAAGWVVACAGIAGAAWARGSDRAAMLRPPALPRVSPPPRGRAAPPEPPPPGAPPADAPPDSDRSASSGVGRSAAKASRMSTISAAMTGRGALCTSPTPFNSICQARDSTRMGSAVAATPRTRSTSVTVDSCAACGTIFRRVTKCTNSARSASTTAGSAPLSYWSRSSVRAVATSPRITASNRSMMRPRSARPSIDRTVSASIVPAPCAMAWSSSDSASRTEPSAARAIIASASGSMRTPSRAQMPARCDDSSPASTRRRSKRWQRDRIVTGTLRISVVANTNLACGGGSSSVFRKALNAFSDSMWTSSMM